MANGYYYQNPNGPYDYYSSSTSSSSSPPLPLHLCLFLFTLFALISLSWYMAYESVLESLLDQLRLGLMLSPLLLLLLVHLLSNDNLRWVSFFVPLPSERESFHRAGGSPWGVALVLVLLIFMISYKSYFQDWWFPFLSR
ncbi:uncharacterized protein LOC122040063 [Zingiber officinale]|uniref:uncharacterized protein LOC122040063 n=1 Tax=Zingiber officinale TaxID=94328 RepID=UPI001C4C371B|nr:uncharacterized protein LOC122040063 [Zingiber officinale]